MVEDLTNQAPVVPAVDGLRARAILSGDDPEVLTFVRATDARTAMSRGLKEWFEEQQLVWEGGRLMKFKAVNQYWAEPEKVADFPSLGVIAQVDAEYQGAPLGAPQLVRTANGDKRYLRQTSEMRQLFQLTVYSTDPMERQGLVALLEDGLNPSEFMTGLRLELPFYFGARATFEPMALSYDDNAFDAQRRQRKATIQVVGNVPVLRPVGDIVDMRPRLDSRAVDPTDPSLDEADAFMAGGPQFK